MNSILYVLGYANLVLGCSLLLRYAWGAHDHGDLGVGIAVLAIALWCKPR